MVRVRAGNSVLVCIRGRSSAASQFSGQPRIFCRVDPIVPRHLQGTRLSIDVKKAPTVNVAALELGRHLGTCCAILPTSCCHRNRHSLIERCVDTHSQLISALTSIFAFGSDFSYFVALSSNSTAISCFPKTPTSELISSTVMDSWRSGRK
jgi:hypothetical protein